ncbi:hypothetical protein MNQ98_11485 [Paenibacillus sp. N3/727]|uniref:hypothetical protein n=1 Tax=Paenibacillus sp. N3/727 TaxID=2925845 RepID=UPI001F52F502|nr:hypothetical protein [Paenibacillus sp. N3/727]UNK20590.1 hypothetical protein MNQ98_11485 [Paenibacillus sp. N3/727]
MADNNETNNRDQDHLKEQKDQFRNFVESVTGENNRFDAVNQDTSHNTDQQNRLIDQHNLRK